MKNKVLKVLLVLLMIITMTSINFIFLGYNINLAIAQSEAINMFNGAVEAKTNNKNVEFTSYLKNENGEIVKSKKEVINSQNMKLYFYINVKQEGYLQGEIELLDSNFNFKKDTKNENISKIEDKKLILNQIKAGNYVEIEVPIEVNLSETFNSDMLVKTSKIKFNATYKDSGENNNIVEAEKEINLNLVSNEINAQNIVNNLEVVTNKKAIIDGKEKRVVQLQLELGLQDNIYPIKSIEAEINVPKIDGKEPRIEKIETLNNMKKYEQNYENSTLKIKMTNEAEENNKDILWKKQGNEKVILTYVYDEYKEIQDTEILLKQVATLQDNKQETANDAKVVLDNNEKDSIITISTASSESSIYKGYLYANKDREIKTLTNINVNLTKVAQNIKVKETHDYKGIFYKQTIVNKVQLEKILGKEFNVTIINSNDNTKIAEINQDSRFGRKWKYYYFIS